MNSMRQGRLGQKGIVAGGVLGAFLLMTFALAPALANPPDNSWGTNLEKAMQVAKQANKPILVMFSATWCPPCNDMKKEVLTQPQIRQQLAAWVPVYLDEAKEPDLVKRFKIEAFPTFVMLNNQGNEMDRFMGGRPLKEFSTRIDEVLKRNKEERFLNDALAKSPQDPKLWKRRGDLVLEQGHADKALEAYKKAQSLDQQNRTGVAADIYFVEALRVGNKDPKAAAEQLAKLGKLYPGSSRISDALFMRALIALQDQHTDEAKGLLQTYLSSYPQGKFAEPVRNMLQELKKQAASGQNPPRPGGTSPKPDGTQP